MSIEKPKTKTPDAFDQAKRRELRERLICAALTGMCARDGCTDRTGEAVRRADEVLAILDKEEAKRDQ